MVCGECGAHVSIDDRFCVDCGALVAGVAADRFTVRGLVGRGESGVSFLAFDSALERLVLMRELAPGVVRDEVRWARIRLAVSHMAGVQDLHCVQIFSLDAEADPPLLFTEWVPGPSMTSVMRSGPVDAAGALTALDGALAGLQRLHQSGLAHGFMTPSRVLLDRAGQSKVADVGLGFGPRVPAEALMFLAPEMFSDGAEPTEPSDVFAAGSLLAGLISARAPFRARMSPRPFRHASSAQSGLMDRRRTWSS